MTLQSLQDWLASLGPLVDRTVAVQRSSLLKVLSRDLNTGQARVRRHDGTELDVSWAETCVDHFPIEGESYLKPRFHPVQALVVDRALTVAYGGQAVELTVGSVVLIDNNRPVTVLSQAEYLRDYDVVHPPTVSDI